MSKLTMTKLLVAAICLLACPAWAQLEVQLRTAKPEFLAGEPIFVVADVKNIGTDPVAYGGASLNQPLQLSVRNGNRRVIKRIDCEWMPVEVRGGILSHPPALRPGEATTFRYLLRGYRLEPGTYELHVSGTVDVAWRQRPMLSTAPVTNRSITEPVEGATIDRSLTLTITAASDDALRAVYAPYVDAAESFISSMARIEAVDAILEMAPPLLEPELRTLIKQFGRDRERDYADAAAQALAEIDTVSSRAELIDWFDRSDDLQVRYSIVAAVARARRPENLPFLRSLLPGRSTPADRNIRRDAALGIGGIGGEAAVKALRDAPRSSDPLVAGAVLLALGNTKSTSAIPVLIDRAEGQNGFVSDDACEALMNLTHRVWCGGVGLEETRKKWRSWWAVNAKNVRVYGPDNCPDPARLPNIW